MYRYNAAPSATTYSNVLSPGSTTALPISFYHARFLAERISPNPLPLPQNGHPLSTSPVSAEVTPEPDAAARILEEVRALAIWLRLHQPTLQNLVVGGLESDPGGIADRLGVKGLSVYTAFIDMELLRCRVCGHQSNGIALAVLHQLHRRHFQY